MNIPSYEYYLLGPAGISHCFLEVVKISTLKLNIYGDSIMKGVVIDETDRYHSTFSKTYKQLQNLFDLQIRNRSQFGNTIHKGRQLLENDLEQGLDCDYVLIEFGGNDCNYRWNEVVENPQGEHQPQIHIDHFKEHYLKILNALKTRSITPILMTLPPIDAERYLKFLVRKGNDGQKLLNWLGDVQMIYRFHELYSNAIAQIAEQTGTLLIDVRSKFLDKRNFKELIGLDGIHPAPAGYKIILNVIQDFTQKHLQLNPIKPTKQ